MAQSPAEVLLAWCERDHHVQHPRAGRDAAAKADALSTASSASCAMMVCDSAIQATTGSAAAPAPAPQPPPPHPLPLPPPPPAARDAHRTAAAAVDALLTAVHAQARESALPVRTTSPPWHAMAAAAAAAAAGSGQEDDAEQDETDGDGDGDEGEEGGDGGGGYYARPYADGRRSPAPVHGSPPSALVYVLCPPREALAAALVAAAAVLAAVAVASVVRP